MLFALALTFAARTADLANPESACAVVYDVISGPVAKKREWDRMRAVCSPDARLIVVGRSKAGEIHQKSMSVEDFISLASPNMESQGFFEREIAHRTEQFGNIAQVWSTYESRFKADGKPFERGINSFQLWNDGKRWWITTIFWQGEDSETKLPAKYLPPGR